MNASTAPFAVDGIEPVAGDGGAGRGLAAISAGNPRSPAVRRRAFRSN